MTGTSASQPQQQSIDGADLKAIEDFIYSTMNHTREWELAENAYQRILTARAAHTSPPARTVEHMQSAYAHGRMDGAKAAREQVLDELLTIPIDDCDVGGACALIQKILSLRAQQEHPSTKGGDR